VIVMGEALRAATGLAVDSAAATRWPGGGVCRRRCGRGERLWRDELRRLWPAELERRGLVHVGHVDRKVEPVGAVRAAAGARPRVDGPVERAVHARFGGLYRAAVRAGDQADREPDLGTGPRTPLDVGHPAMVSPATNGWSVRIFVL
jgi:hypothetical protein